MHAVDVTADSTTGRHPALGFQLMRISFCFVVTGNISSDVAPVAGEDRSLLDRTSDA